MSMIFLKVETDCPPECQEGGGCSVCGFWLCPEHSPGEFTTCAGDPNLLHHVGCETECLDCTGAQAQDVAEDRFEACLRGED